MVIAPVEAFSKNGEWYKKIIDNDRNFFEENTDLWKTSAGSVVEDKYREDMIFADDHLEDITDTDKAEVLYSINIQNQYYAVILLNS